MADAGESYALQQRKPKSILDLLGSALSSDFSRLGTNIWDAAASPSRLLNAHMGEYQPGASVQDMPQTMEQLPETAMNIVGTPGMEVPGVTLNSGVRLPKKLPPLPEVLHGSGSPAEYVRPAVPPPTHDLGIHATVNPNIPVPYAFKHVEDNPLNFFEGFSGYQDHAVDFMSGKKFNDPDAAWPRVKPYLFDTKNALQFPGDAIKWNSPESVIQTLAAQMRQGYVAPRGLLSDMYNIAKSDKMWQDQFIPMLKDKGYDSLYYPHHDPGTRDTKYNSFMGFDPEQFIPRFSPEASQLIKERGIKGAIKNPRDYEPYEGVFETIPPWSIPQGILKKPDEIESLVRLPSKNTVNWWEDPKSPLSKIIRQEEEQRQAYLKQVADFNKQNNIPYTPTKSDPATPNDSKLAMLKLKQDDLKDLLNKGKIKFKEFDAMYQNLEDMKDQHYGNMVSKSALAPKGVLDPGKWGDKGYFYHLNLNKNKL
jgi:hypothetical protein